jgi:toxin ParE1/3/4
MRYQVYFRKEAQRDILEAIEWYEKRRAGLGDELFIAIEIEKHLIEQNPYHYEEKFKGIRKAITKRFPYILYYRIEPNNQVLVYAVLHMKINPRQWKKRVK